MSNRYQIRTSTRLVISACGLLGMACQAHGASVLTVFYDIDFASPPHVVGARPAVGEGPDTPSNIVYGRPEVVAAFGALTEQPVVLNTAGNIMSFYYDQFRLALGVNENNYHLSFDLHTEALIGSRNGFSVLFDSQPLTRLDFLPNGFFFPPGWGRAEIPFADGVPMRIDVSFDRQNNRVVTLLDGNLVSDIRIADRGRPGDLTSIRFSLGARFFTDANDPSTSVAIDNIRVTNGFLIPEAAIATKIALAAVLAIGIRKRH